MLVRRADLVAGSTVAHDVVAGAEEARLAGLVGRDVWTRTNGTQLAGSVGRDAEVTSDRVLVEGRAVIAGRLSATVASARDLQIAEGAQVRGGWRVIDEMARKAAWEIRGPRYVPSQFLAPSFYFWQGLLLCAALFAGALLFWLVPGCFELRPQAAAGILKAMGVGFVVLVATPLVSLVVALTLVGLPIACAIACAWVALVYLSGLFAAAWIGRVILRHPLSGARPFLLALLVGEVVLRIATHLPFVDTALWLCALVFGSGLASMSLPRLWGRLRTS
jgi:hypothetical protein